MWLRKPAEPSGSAGRGSDAGGKALPVVAAPVTKGPIDVYLNALGTVTPRNMVTVHSRVDGQLMRVAFREGQVVKAGELLAEIDPRPFQVQFTQAQGQMAKDQALLKNAQLDLERYRTLLSQDSISKQQVDTQESLVRQYQGAVQADQGQIDSAKLQLTYSRVTAPISGVVGLRQVDPGNVIHANDANGLVVITQIQPITVLFPIPEDNLPRVLGRMKSGATLAVEAYDRAQKVKLATGKLSTVDNQIDTTTGTVKLRAEFPNDDGALFPNQFVNVRMVVETHEDATLVPSAAIQRGAPLRVVSVSLRRPIFWLVTRPEYRSVKDLKGKVLATATIGGSQHTAAKKMISLGGLDPDKDLTTIAGGEEARHLQGLVSNTVQVSAISPPWVLLARDKYKMNVLDNAVDSATGYVIHTMPEAPRIFACLEEVER